MRPVYYLCLVVTLTGCAAGFDRGAIQQRLAGEQVQVKDEEIKEALEKEPQLRFPISLAVKLDSASFSPSRHRENNFIEPASDWRWSLKDKEHIESYASVLKEKGIIEKMFVLSDIAIRGSGTKSDRLAAAQCGADAVLIINGVSQVDSYVNPLCLLNLLILPGWVIPASHRNALFVMQGMMIDVGNEFLYLTVETEGEAKTLGPTFTIKDEKAIDEAKEIALEDFMAALEKRLSSLKGDQE